MEITEILLIAPDLTENIAIICGNSATGHQNSFSPVILKTSGFNFSFLAAFFRDQIVMPGTFKLF